MGDKNSTTQVKDIKPGVLSKIFLLAEKDPETLSDPNIKELCKACKDVQDELLEIANDKDDEVALSSKQDFDQEKIEKYS